MKVNVTEEAFAGSGWNDVIKKMAEEGRGPADIIFRVRYVAETKRFEAEIITDSVKKFENDDPTQWALQSVAKIIVLLLEDIDRPDITLSLMIELWKTLKAGKNPVGIATYIADDSPNNYFVRGSETTPSKLLGAAKAAVIYALKIHNAPKDRIKKATAILKMI